MGTMKTAGYDSRTLGSTVRTTDPMPTPLRGGLTVHDEVLKRVQIVNPNSDVFSDKSFLA